MNEFKRNDNEAPLGSIIDKLMKAYGFEKKLKELDVIDAWPELMGKAVAHRTKSLKISNKVLYISMDSSVMRDELLHGKSIIIQRVNEFAGTELITDIWFG